MTISLEELAESMGGLDKLSQASESLGLTLKEVYEDSDPELAQLMGYAPEDKPTPEAPKAKKQKKGSGLSRIETQATEGKGQLTQANQQFAKTAIANTVKQMAGIADLEMRTGATAYLARKTQNVERLTSTIGEYSDLTISDISALEEELDIDALLGEVADPLPLFA